MSSHNAVALLVMTDGRDHLIDQTIDSAETSLLGPIGERWIHDDSGSADHRETLRNRFPRYEVIWHPRGRQGFAGAVKSAWLHLRRHSACPYVFHLEDDFTFNHLVRLEAMIHLLQTRPYLAQVALRRQAWNDAERAAGGVVELHPDAYTERHLQTCGTGLGCENRHHAWLEHRLFWTTNPSMYRAETMARGWPQLHRSEGAFTHRLLADPDLRFAYLGGRDTDPWVEHIGVNRAPAARGY